MADTEPNTAQPNPTSPTPPNPPIDWRALLRTAQRLAHTAWQMIRGEADSPLSDVRAALGHISPRRLFVSMAGLAVLGYLASGLFIVAPGEIGVIRRFGAVTQPRVAPGLRYHLPWPIERVDRVNVAQVRRERIGITAPEEDHDHPEPPSKLQALSGDTNVIDIEIIVQYQVSDPAAFLVNVKYAPYRLMREMVRGVVTDLVTKQQVDNILTTERQSLQNALRTEAQARLDAYRSGLTIVGVNLQKGFPPEEVAQAFTDVNGAKEDRARVMNEARGYANSLIPQARGQANQIRADADAYRSRTVSQAKGAAQAFDALLRDYETNAQIYGQDVTRYRLYLETMDKVLPNVQVYVIDNDGKTNLRLYTTVQRSSASTGQ